MKTTKNKSIAKSLKKTRKKRLSQSCRVFTLKIDQSALSKEQAEYMKMQFVEAKWIVNEAIGSDDIFKYAAGSTVNRLDKDGNQIETELKYLGSQQKQSIIEQLKSNIKTLSSLKKKGKKVGQLKFKKEINSIELKQFGTTYNIISKRKIKIQKIPGEIRVNGLNQILSKKGNPKFDFANARIVRTSLGYFVKVTCFEKKQKRKCSGEIGLDFGIATVLTLSDGRKFDASVQESDRLKRLQRQFSKQQKGSKRRTKTLQLIRKEQQKMSFKKDDKANKIVAEVKKFEFIYMQDENISGWKCWFGKQIHHSILGRLKSKLKPIATNVLSRWEPTTKLCTACGTMNALSLGDRTFKCTCGIEMDRDIHAAQNMIIISKINRTGTVRINARGDQDKTTSRISRKAQIVESRRFSVENHLVEDLNGNCLNLQQDDATSLV